MTLIKLIHHPGLWTTVERVHNRYRVAMHRSPDGRYLRSGGAGPHRTSSFLYARQTLAAVAHVPVRRGLANARAASGLRSGPALLIYLTGPITWDAAIQLVVRRPAE